MKVLVNAFGILNIVLCKKIAMNEHDIKETLNEAK